MEASIIVYVSLSCYVYFLKVPILLIFTLADTEAIGMFNALQRKGIPSKFVYFPKENVGLVPAVKASNGLSLICSIGFSIP